MRRHLVVSGAAALMLSACVTMSDNHPLTGTAWQLVAIDTSGSTTTLTPALQRRHTIVLREEGELDAQLDCNRGRGTWSAGRASSGSGTITIGPVASTRMACPQPSFGEQMASGLSAAQRYTATLDGRQLVIEAPDLRLTFAAAE